MNLDVIYEPETKAREYADLACNLFVGCSHMCTYCWAARRSWVDKAAFVVPVERKNILRRLERDANKIHGDKRRVLFCFTTDPYMPIDVDTDLTRRAIEILHLHELKVNILTKGGDRSLRDLDLLGPGDKFGTTLTLIKQEDSMAWEPGAAPPHERIGALEAAKETGATTWVSLEPIIDVEQTLHLIDLSHRYVDQYMVGKMNHMAVPGVDWYNVLSKVMAQLSRHNADYYVKDDMWCYRVPTMDKQSAGFVK